MKERQKFNSYQNLKTTFEQSSVQQNYFYSQLEKRNQKAKYLISLKNKKHESNIKKLFQVSTNHSIFPKISDRYKQSENKNLNHLRNQTQSQKQQILMLQNRIKYYQLCKSRNQNIKKQAEHKYYSMMKIRNKNLETKSEILELRKMNQKQKTDFLHQVRNRSIKEKQQHRKKLMNFKHKFSQNLSQLRQSKCSTRKFFTQQKILTSQKNKQLASSIKQREIQLLKKKKEDQLRKKSIALSNHNEKIYHEDKKKQELSKKSKYLYKKMIQLESQVKNLTSENQFGKRKDSMISLNDSRRSRGSSLKFLSPYSVFITKY